MTVITNATNTEPTTIGTVWSVGNSHSPKKENGREMGRVSLVDHRFFLVTFPADAQVVIGFFKPFLQWFEVFQQRCRTHF